MDTDFIILLIWKNFPALPAGQMTGEVVGAGVGGERVVTTGHE